MQLIKLRRKMTPRVMKKSLKTVRKMASSLSKKGTNSWMKKKMKFRTNLTIWISMMIK